MIVADASLIARFAIRNEQSTLADAVCERDAEWAAPLLWRSEFREALVQCIQRAGMSLESALVALQSAEEILAGREYRVASERILELGRQSPCTAFACEYVALAGELGVPLVTADRELVRAFPKIAVSLEDFARTK